MAYIHLSFFWNRLCYAAVHATMKNGQRTPYLVVDLPRYASTKEDRHYGLLRKQSSANARTYFHFRTAQMISRGIVTWVLAESTHQGRVSSRGVFLLGNCHRMGRYCLEKQLCCRMGRIGPSRVMIEPTRGIHLWLHDVRHAPLEKISLGSITRKALWLEAGGKRNVGDFQGTLQRRTVWICTNHLQRIWTYSEVAWIIGGRRGFGQALIMIKLVLPSIGSDSSFVWVEELLVSKPWCRGAPCMRKEKSVSVVQAFIAWCAETLKLVYPKSPMVRHHL